jgi:C-terminal processing protease CtpA/Prc
MKRQRYTRKPIGRSASSTFKKIVFRPLCACLQVISGSPAAQAGLVAGLTIRRIDGVDLEGKTLADCVALIRGEAGTQVRLELVHPDHNETNTGELTRAKFGVN